jgi:hypothetical protein
MEGAFREPTIKIGSERYTTRKRSTIFIDCIGVSEVVYTEKAAFLLQQIAMMEGRVEV